MANFLIDENVSPRLVEPLAARGHPAYHVRGLGLAGAVDADILLSAVDRGLTLITENHHDFLILHQAWHLWARRWRLSPLPIHHGILTIPQLPVLRLNETAEAIARLVSVPSQLPNELHQWRLALGWQAHSV